MKVRINREAMRLIRREGMMDLMGVVDSLAEAERTSRWERYRPLPSQNRFHHSQAQTRGFIGGNRSGKTTAGVIEALWYAMGRHPYRTVIAPNSGWIVALDNEVLADVILPKLFEYLPEEKIKRFNQVKGILELINGSVIKFKSCDSGPGKFQSAERRWIWFDEEPPYEIWRESRLRVGANYPLDVWLTMTPLLGMDWTYTELVEQQVPGATEIFGASLRDNFHLLKSERDRLVAEFEHSPDAVARLDGGYFQKSGLIYPGLREEIHLIDPFPIPLHWPVIRAMDTHQRTPSAATWAALSPKDELFFFDELWDKQEVLFSDWAERVLEKDRNRRIVASLIDPSAKNKTNVDGQKDIQSYLSEDLGIPSTDANRDHPYGYAAVRERITGARGPRIFFFKTCYKTWRQTKNLIYEEWRSRGQDRAPKEEQRKKDDHLPDCVRYTCAEGVVYEDESVYSQPPPPPRGRRTAY